MKKKDLYSGAFLCILFAAAFIMALEFPAKSREFPIFITVFGFVLSVVLLIRGIVSAKKETSAAEQQPASSKSKKNIFFTFLSLVVYAVLIPRLGFCVSTFLYLIASMLVLYPEKKTTKTYVVIFAISAIFVVFLYVVFKVLLYVPLPKGLLV